MAAALLGALLLLGPARPANAHARVFVGGAIGFPVYPYPYPYYYPPPPRVAPPPPLSPVMRVIYAPFYAAGLVVRYGVYYVLVAPLEVFSRTVSYGAKGGVEAPPPPPSRGGEDPR